MALRSYQPNRAPHRFDIVAYDEHGKPALVVEIVRHTNHGDFKQLAREVEGYIANARRQVPFFVIANSETVLLFRQTPDRQWELAHKFDAEAVFRRYDDAYGQDPIFESYLTSLFQAWLNDIADNWRSSNPPGAEVFAQNDLLDVIQRGSLSLESTL